MEAAAEPQEEEAGGIPDIASLVEQGADLNQLLALMSMMGAGPNMGQV